MAVTPPHSGSRDDEFEIIVLGTRPEAVS